MKKFILKLFIFACLVITIDIAIGGMYILYNQAHGGETGKAHEIMTKVEPDLLVIGSSRAMHHYDPKILEGKLGLNAYNAGFDGQGTLLGYGLLKGMLSRHKPKIIICELTPQFDVYKDNKNVSINILAPYHKVNGVDSLFNDIDYTEKYKMISNAYVYNSKLLRILPNIILGRDGFLKGYDPLSSSMKAIRNSPPLRQLHMKPIQLS